MQYIDTGPLALRESTGFVYSFNEAFLFFSTGINQQGNELAPHLL
jgi:hypothetical protein